MRLLELADHGLAPEATIADFGSGLGQGQALALPTVPCRGDIFHLVRDLEKAVSHLETRCTALEECLGLEQERERWRRKDWPLHAVGQHLGRARTTCNAAVALADDVGTLLSMAAAGCAGRGPATPIAWCCTTLSWKNCERRPACSHQLSPIYRLLKNRRDELLAFAHRARRRAGPAGRGVGHGVPKGCIGCSTPSTQSQRRPAWGRGDRQCAINSDQFLAACQAVNALAAGTVRASSLVENLNGRLRPAHWCATWVRTTWICCGST